MLLNQQPSLREVIARITKKETTLFFNSPTAYLFLFTFVAVTLFVFFWGSSFFVRNISDVRPMFEWIPVLLIFLCSALTMKLWSEEHRQGTIEHIFTQAIPLWYFVLAKFLSCMILLSLALIMTLPLPISVAMIGHLDWGPVWSGYVATLFLGGAYISMGLLVSARTTNQIVSLLGSCLLCGLFYLIGTDQITTLVATPLNDIMRSVATGAHFKSITRGIIDFRDLYYYITLIVIFLTLNTFVLEKQRWVSNHEKKQHHQKWQIITTLIIGNVMAMNLWLQQLHEFRLDMTDGQIFSISKTTEAQLQQLQEPLTIRGYFSAKTHPLLAPLVPQLKDLIREYGFKGQGRVQVEFVDPIESPSLEEEAGQRFEIKPVPLKIADKYQSSIVNAYFHILVQYGNEHQVLSFADLIEVKVDQHNDVDVQLRNPEHDITKAIKNVTLAYQTQGELFDTITNDITLTAYISHVSALPETLRTLKGDIQNVISNLDEQVKSHITFKWIDPELNQGDVAKQIQQDFGFQPMRANLFDRGSFYFYFVLSDTQQSVQIPMEAYTKEEFEKNFMHSLQKFSTGFTKTIALVTPPKPQNTPYGAVPGLTFQQIERFLQQDYKVIQDDLTKGFVNSEADILLLLAPKQLTQKQVLAIDQFLMKGGTIIAATSPFSASFVGGLELQPYTSGLEDWLTHIGLSIAPTVVLDPNNTPFPMPTTRRVGNLELQEMHLIDYPYFADIRQGLQSDHLITSHLQQTTMTWASPIKIDGNKNQTRTITTLLSSSEQAWLSNSKQIMPSPKERGLSAFQPQGERAAHPVGVMSVGSFASFFKNKQTQPAADEQAPLQIDSILTQSPTTAKVILFAANDFLSDRTLQIISNTQQAAYTNSLHLIQNTIDWSLADAGLLSIRARSHFNRTLPPLSQDTQMFWEYLNYAMALLMIGALIIWQRVRRQQTQQAFKREFLIQGDHHA